MSKGYLPDGDSALASFVLNMSTKITAAPTDYGLVAADATTLADALSAYTTALAACEPTVRSMPAVATKNAVRSTLKDQVRLIAKKVTADPSVTDAQRHELGLNVRAVPQPISRPATRPAMEVTGVVGPVVSVNIHDSASSSKRGKPAGAVAAWVYSFVGAEYPSDPLDWKFEGATTHAKFDVTFDRTLPSGTQVYICAAWINAKQEAGPQSEPISTNLQYAGAMSGATLKVAA